MEALLKAIFAIRDDQVLGDLEGAARFLGARPDAGHAFFNDTRPNFRPQAAAQLWEDMVPFLARHVQG